MKINVFISFQFGKDGLLMMVSDDDGEPLGKIKFKTFFSDTLTF